MIVCLSIFSVQGQQKDSTVNKSITITRNYKPQIWHNNKISSIPKMKKMKMYKPMPEYLNISTTMGLDYYIPTLQVEELWFENKDYYSGLVRVGFGNPINTLANVVVPVYNSEKNKLNMTFNHLGTFNNKKYSNTNCNLYYKHFYDDSNVFFNVGIQHDFFNYYGNVFRNNSILKNITPYYNMVYKTDNSKTIRLKKLFQLRDRDNHFRIQPTVGVRSFSFTESLTWDADLSYKMFYSDNNRIAEHQLYARSLFQQKLNENLLELNTEIFNFVYNSDYNDFKVKNNDYLNYSLIKLNPYYKIEHENWFVKLGAKASISISAGKVFSPSPDIEFKWNAIPQYLAFLGAISGDVKINSLDKTYKENRYLSPQNRLEDTYIPVDSYLKMSVSPIDNFIFDIYGEYQIISNPYFYINKPYLNTGGNFYHNRFDVVVENSTVQKTAIGFNFAWNYLDKVNVYSKTKYNRWYLDKQVHAWHMPEWEVKVGTNVKINNNIEINSQFVFEDGRYAILSNPNGIKMKPIYDWNISGTYSYSERLSFFLGINNILNQKYQVFKGYDTESFRLMIGTAFYF